MVSVLLNNVTKLNKNFASVALLKGFLATVFGNLKYYIKKRIKIQELLSLEFRRDKNYNG